MGDYININKMSEIFKKRLQTIMLYWRSLGAASMSLHFCRPTFKAMH